MSSPTPPWNNPEVRPLNRAELSGSRSLRDMVEAYERSLILIALAAADFNQRRAARMLGLLPTTLNEKMRRFGIRPGGQSDVAASARDYRANDAAFMMSTKTPEAQGID